MSKFQLKLEDDFDFLLIGISCHQKDYRLCFELNKALEMDLIRDNDLVINKNNERAGFSLSLYHDEENHCEYYLLANKGMHGYLVPEQKTADFFLMMKGAVSADDSYRMVQSLKRLDMVLAAFEIDPQSLRSKENLLF